MIQIIIGGDICPIGDIKSSFVVGDANAIFNDLMKDINDSDLSVVNLECPLISDRSPISKPGTVLGAENSCINGFVAAKWDVLNFANNHSFDHGIKGLLETIHTVRTNGLSVVGAGETIKEACIPFIKDINGQRIAIYSMAEREFSIADENTPGANPLDLINFINAVKQYKQNGTFIVLLHGGKEFYSYPSPEMVKRCRFMVDMGADAVICCHTHCPLPWEIYADRPIVYGLGNLIFEPLRKQTDTWHKGYLAQLTIEHHRVALKTIPYIQSQGFLGAKKMDESAQSTFYSEMQKKSDELKNSKFVNEKWMEYCKGQKVSYLEMLFGYNRLMRKASWFLLNRLHSKNDMLRALLLAQCETHREILNTLFRLERFNR